MNIWELGVLIMAITFMVINVWNMFITTKLLSKFSPMIDKSMRLFDKMLDQANEEMNYEETKTLDENKFKRNVTKD